MTYSKQVQADPRKVERAKDLEVRFTPRVQKTLDAWNAKAATNTGADQKKLIIKPNIQLLKIVSGGARFFAGAWSFGSTDTNLMNYVGETAN